MGQRFPDHNNDDRTVRASQKQHMAPMEYTMCVCMGSCNVCIWGTVHNVCVYGGCNVCIWGTAYNVCMYGGACNMCEHLVCSVCIWAGAFNVRGLQYVHGYYWSMQCVCRDLQPM